MSRGALLSEQSTWTDTMPPASLIPGLSQYPGLSPSEAEWLTSPPSSFADTSHDLSKYPRRRQVPHPTKGFTNNGAPSDYPLSSHVCGRGVRFCAVNPQPYWCLVQLAPIAGA